LDAYRSRSPSDPILLSEKVRIFVTEEAFEAIKATLRIGSVMYEAELNENSERLIWVERWPTTHRAKLVHRPERHADRFSLARYRLENEVRGTGCEHNGHCEFRRLE
jgi:hypothetical protein